MRRMFFMLVIAGCAQSAPPPASPPTTMMMGRGSGMGLCPLVQSGASVGATDTPDGVALVVIAPESQRLAVRQYLRQMATHHEQTRVGGRPGHQEKLPPHSATALDTELGGQLVFLADEADQLPELRKGVRTHVADLLSRCARRP